jgi:hypothetical protein
MIFRKEFRELAEIYAMVACALANRRLQSLGHIANPVLSRVAPGRQAPCSALAGATKLLCRSCFVLC